MSRLADWWDGVELWLTQLWFPFQVALVIVVLLPLCWVTTVLLDAAVGRLFGRSGRRGTPTG